MLHTNNIIRTPECKNCGELIAVLFTVHADGVFRCITCKQNLTEEESEDQHIDEYHASCCLRCKISLNAKKSHEYAKNNKGKVGIVAGAIAAPAMLPLIGFTAAGVAGGSIAAGAQSVVYGAYTTGVFSLLQSAGTGAVAATSAVMAGGGTIGGVVAKIVDANTGGKRNATSTESVEGKQEGPEEEVEKKQSYQK